MSLKGKSKQINSSVRQGFKDIKTVLAEGEYKLFLKPMIAVIVLFLIYNHSTAALKDRSAAIGSKMEALQAQQNNEKEYLSSKAKLLKLEPRFPNISEKNNWLQGKMDTILREAAIKSPKIGNLTADDSNDAYSVVSVTVDASLAYADAGKLLANIEGREEFLKVSEFVLAKKPVSEDSLGMNGVKLRVETVFPTEKIAKTLFKDTATGGKK